MRVFLFAWLAAADKSSFESFDAVQKSLEDLTAKIKASTHVGPSSFIQTSPVEKADESLRKVAASMRSDVDKFTKQMDQPSSFLQTGRADPVEKPLEELRNAVAAIHSMQDAAKANLTDLYERDAQIKADLIQRETHAGLPGMHSSLIQEGEVAGMGMMAKIELDDRAIDRQMKALKTQHEDMQKRADELMADAKADLAAAEKEDKEPMPAAPSSLLQESGHHHKHSKDENIDYQAMADDLMSSQDEVDKDRETTLQKAREDEATNEIKISENDKHWKEEFEEDERHLPHFLDHTKHHHASSFVEVDSKAQMSAEAKIAAAQAHLDSAETELNNDESALEIDEMHALARSKEKPEDLDATSDDFAGKLSKIENKMKTDSDAVTEEMRSLKPTLQKKYGTDTDLPKFTATEDTVQGVAIPVDQSAGDALDTLRKA